MLEFTGQRQKPDNTKALRTLEIYIGYYKEQDNKMLDNTSSGQRRKPDSMKN